MAFEAFRILRIGTNFSAVLQPVLRKMTSKSLSVRFTGDSGQNVFIEIWLLFN